MATLCILKPKKTYGVKENEPSFRMLCICFNTLTYLKLKGVPAIKATLATGIRHVSVKKLMLRNVTGS